MKQPRRPTALRVLQQLRWRYSITRLLDGPIFLGPF